MTEPNIRCRHSCLVSLVNSKQKSTVDKPLIFFNFRLKYQQYFSAIRAWPINFSLTRLNAYFINSLLQIKDTKYLREYPSEKNSYACCFKVGYNKIHINRKVMNCRIPKQYPLYSCRSRIAKCFMKHLRRNISDKNWTTFRWLPVIIIKLKFEYRVKAVYSDQRMNENI